MISRLTWMLLFAIWLACCGSAVAVGWLMWHTPAWSLVVNVPLCCAVAYIAGRQYREDISQMVYERGLEQ